LSFLFCKKEATRHRQLEDITNFISFEK